MKKKLFVAFVTVIVSLMTYAQDVQVVTLQHGDNMQAFYGSNAFKEALDAATTGDVLSLSAGTFSAADVTKAVTIQGAGYVQDIPNGRYRTSIDGALNIKMSSNESGLTIEGIDFLTAFYVYGAIEGMSIKKCKLETVDMVRYECASKNCYFEQCRIKHISPDLLSQNLLFKNCIIRSFAGNSEGASVLIDHCIYLQSTENRNTIATFKNSIVRDYTYYAWGISKTSSFFYNNILCLVSDPVNADGNYFLSETELKNLFADGELAYTDERTYELTSAAAQQYLGNDGTQVGIYGSDTPFTNIPTNPQITSREVATKTDADGKLSVKIVVEAQ